MTPFENLALLVRLATEYKAEASSDLGDTPEALRRAKAQYHHDFPPAMVLELVEVLRAFEWRGADLAPLLRHEIGAARLVLDKIGAPHEG